MSHQPPYDRHLPDANEAGSLESRRALLKKLASMSIISASLGRSAFAQVTPEDHDCGKFAGSDPLYGATYRVDADCKTTGPVSSSGDGDCGLPSEYRRPNGAGLQTHGDADCRYLGSQVSEGRDADCGAPDDLIGGAQNDNDCGIQITGTVEFNGDSDCALHTSGNPQTDSDCGKLTSFGDTLGYHGDADCLRTASDESCGLLDGQGGAHVDQLA